MSTGERRWGGLFDLRGMDEGEAAWSIPGGKAQARVPASVCKLWFVAETFQSGPQHPLTSRTGPVQPSFLPEPTKAWGDLMNSVRALC